MASSTAVLSLPSTPESARQARKKFFRSQPKEELENWLSTCSKEIKESKFADVFESFIRVQICRHPDTCEVWRLLHEARSCSDELLTTEKLNRVVQLLGNCTVEGIDENMRDRLENASPESAQEAIQTVYEHLTYEFLHNDRCSLDLEIQAAIQEQANNEQVSLEERHRRRCCFLV